MTHTYIVPRPYHKKNQRIILKNTKRNPNQRADNTMIDKKNNLKDKLAIQDSQMSQLE